jgi:CHAT domain-containing protein
MTAPADPRSVEPRLSSGAAWQPCSKRLRDGHVVEDAVCGATPIPAPVVSTRHEDCEEMTSTPAEALRTLVEHPLCTDAVVDRLQAQAAEHPAAKAWSDLAAAYYLRAQRDDEPTDLLRALDAAMQAVERAPRSPDALFNRALAQEALGFREAAVASWDAFRRVDHSQWASEAAAHHRRLLNEMTATAAAQWELNLRRISEAFDRGDLATVLTLVGRFPNAAQQYVENDLLPQWAEALSRGDAPGAARQLKLADAIARALARSGDHYLLDDLALIERWPGDPTLREGHIALGRARAAEKAFKASEAEAFNRQAERLLSAAGSPLRGAATLGVVRAVAFHDEGPWIAMPLLIPVEREAGARGYRGLYGRVRAMRGFLMFFQSRYVESLASYDDARDAFAAMGDDENAARASTRAVAALRTLGNSPMAWRTAFTAREYVQRFSDVSDRHALLGETAATALALGYPRVAFLYQDAAVRLFQEQLGATHDPDQLARLRHNLGIALRERAGIQVAIGRFAEAQQDVTAAEQLADEPDETMRRAVMARVAEVEGRTVARSDPQRAVEAFSRALSLAAPGEYRTYRAVLLAQRAETYHELHRNAEAERDFRAALSELRTEETEILAHRARGRGEELWSPYFSRFQETYDRLIRLLAEEHRDQEAFGYAEKARAFEPLNLVLQLGALPDAFRDFSVHGSMTLSRIQRELPRGTFLVEYCVLEDRTYAWVFSRDAFHMLTLPVRRSTLESWTAGLQRESRDESAFEAHLAAPYDALIALPLARIAKMPDGGAPDRRVVFIPDHVIQGLPLSALWNREKRKYLMQEITLSVSGSATLYIFSLRRDRALPKADPPSVLLIADPAFNQRLQLTAGFGRLPRARREVARIHQLYGTDATELVDVRATFPAFLDYARGSTVVHLAGHAVANPRAPFRSLLLLAPSGDHPGTVTAEELLTKPRLERTRLFVLSACSSAGGLPVGSEGIAPLVRPLVAAGVPGVVGTLWNVSDSLYEELLVDFHRHYREGYDAAAALQRAQLDQLDKKSRGLRSVLAWAPFQVIGYASPPFPHQRRRNLQ